jgi:hypothetical protein
LLVDFSIKRAEINLPNHVIYAFKALAELNRRRYLEFWYLLLQSSVAMDNKTSTTTGQVMTTSSLLYCPEINAIIFYPSAIANSLLIISMLIGIPLNLIVVAKLLQLQLYKRQSYAAYVLVLSVVDVLSALSELGTIVFLNQYVFQAGLNAGQATTSVNSLSGILICNIAPAIKYIFVGTLLAG